MTFEMCLLYLQVTFSSPSSLRSSALRESMPLSLVYKLMDLFNRTDGRLPINLCMEMNENIYFKRLETIAAAIVEEAKALLNCNPTAVMQTRPTQATLSATGSNGQFISDGHYALCESKGSRVVSHELSAQYGKLFLYEHKTALACDRAEIEEYKRKNTWENENDNNKKILGNAAQIMYADPFRRFMFGMTIANTTTWLWFFSRAMVVVSEPFDFILEYCRLINYVVSMSFGCTEQLGYDSTITRVAVPLKAEARYCIQYDYRINGETYRTVECLSSFRASGILSRATRVWSVRKLGDQTCPECALKDFCIPLDSQTESEIEKDIFQHIEELTILRRGRIPSSINSTSRTYIHR
ncbi:hypothetical protein DFS33DRAFT_161632 [Desarmillaria ectypa]|nr:hypothetical protein DFS33DRAFT_161632 [Desarmillaria ectypa]